MTSRNNRLVAKTVIVPRDKVHLSAFNRKQSAGFFDVSDKIQRPKILKWKKKSINNKKNQNKKTPPASSMTPACAFSMDQSSMQAIYSEGKGRIPVSVACFIYSIAEVWTANTCLTTACFANNGTCRRCEKHAADYYCSFKMLPTVRITHGGLDFSQIIRS